MSFLDHRAVRLSHLALLLLELSGGADRRKVELAGMGRVIIYCLG